MKSKINDKIQSLVLVTLLLFLPLIYSFQTIDPVSSIRLMFQSVILLILIITLLIKSNNFQINTTPVISSVTVIILSLFFLINLVSLVNVINLQEGLFELCKVSIWLVLLITLIFLFRSSKNQSYVISVITLSGLILSIIGLLQYFQLGFTNLPGNIIPFGTMANKNLLASAIFLCLPFSIISTFRDNKLTRYFGAATVAFSLVLILISKTRSVYLGLAVGLLFSLLALAMNSKTFNKSSIRFLNIIKKYSKIIIAVILILSLIFLISGLLYLSNDYKSETNSNYTSIESIQIRLGLWSKSIQMYFDNPILGVGIGNWKIVLPYYGVEGRVYSQSSTFFQRPHNDFLWNLTESGPVGLLLYLGLFLYAIIRCIKILKNSSEDDKIIKAWMFLFGIIGFMVISFFSYPRERIFHMAIFMVYLAMIESISFTSVNSKQTNSKPFTIMFLLIMGAVTIFSLFLSITRFNAEKHVKLAVAAGSVNNWSMMVAQIDKVNFDFVNVDPTSTPLACYRGIANSQLNRLDEAFDDYQRALDANPNHIQVLNNLATLYEMDEKHQEAIELYQKALQVSPKLEQTLVNLAAVYYNIGDFETAYKYITAQRVGPADPRYDQFLLRITEEYQKDIQIDNSKL